MTADLTADQLETILLAAIEQRDMEGVEAALTLLAARDPRRAEVLMDTMRVALAIAKEGS